jgi:cyclic pyranopterin phosphate synthase
MRDSCGRNIDYLRISVTDRCNLHCMYCSAGLAEVLPSGRPSDDPHYLSAAEIGRITEVMAGLGIRKVRITGGEPLLRPDLEQIIAMVARVPGISAIAMTSNGIGLAGRARQLKDAGLQRVNISLDSLDNGKFAAITGGGNLAPVLKGIKAAVAAGLEPVKINVVLMKGINDDEIDPFIELTRENPVEVRFIELMPIGRFGADHSERLLSNTAILDARPWLKELPGAPNQTAQRYAVPGYRGRIGLISPISQQFCAGCNRIRLTCDGKLKPCLGDNTELDIAAALRHDPERLAGLIRKTILEKPAGHQFERGFASKRSMAAIGG